MGAGHDHHHHEPGPVDGSRRDEGDDRPLSIARRRFLTGMGGRRGGDRGRCGPGR